MHLAFDDHRVEHVAAVVDRRVGHEIDLAGVGIDLHLGDVDSRSETSAACRSCPWCRGFRRSSLARLARSRTAKSCGRCRPLRSCHCGTGCRLSDGFQRGGGDLLALRQHHVGGRERWRCRRTSPSASRPRQSRSIPWSVSPCRCSILSGIDAELIRRAAGRTRWRGSGRSIARCSPRINLSPPGNATEASSIGSAPACSSMQEMPMPRSFLRLADWRLRLLKLS